MLKSHIVLYHSAARTKEDIFRRYIHLRVCSGKSILLGSLVWKVSLSQFCATTVHRGGPMYWLGGALTPAKIFEHPLCHIKIS